MTLKKIHRAEMLYKIFANFSFAIGAGFFFILMFLANEDSIMQTIALKAIGFVGCTLFANLGFLFESLAKKCKIKFAKVLKQRETRAAFKVEMAHL